MKESKREGEEREGKPVKEEEESAGKEKGTRGGNAEERDEVRREGL